MIHAGTQTVLFAHVSLDVYYSLHWVRRKMGWFAIKKSCASLQRAALISFTTFLVMRRYQDICEEIREFGRYVFFQLTNSSTSLPSYIRALI